MIAMAALLVGLGLAAVAYGLALRGRSRREKLRQLLEFELAEPTRSPEALSEIMERAGAYAERAFGRTPTAGRLRERLTQAGSSLKAGEFGAVLAVAAFTMGILAWMLGDSFIAGIVVAAVTPVAGMIWLKERGHKRIETMENQLPAVLQLLAGSLDSGSSLLLAMELAGEEGDPPMATELNRVVAETRVGRPMLEALEAMAARIGSRDISWTVEAIRIQHQTGGRLADTLRVLADFMRSRGEIRGEIRALSAEARISGKILTALPIGIGAFLYFFQDGYLDPLITSTLGKIMLGAAAIGMAIGTLWMRRMVQVEV